MSTLSLDLSRFTVSNADPPIHRPNHYVIFKFNKNTPDLEDLYNVVIDRSDEASAADLALIYKALPSLENHQDMLNGQVILSFRRVFESISWSDMQRLKQRSVQRPDGDDVPEMPDLDTYFRVDFKPRRATRERLQNDTSLRDELDDAPGVFRKKLTELPRECEHVERAFFGRGIGVPPVLPLGGGQVTPLSYRGIGIREFQDEYKEADGRYTRFVDIEQGWEYTHSALSELPETVPISGVNRNWIWSNREGKWVNVGLHGLMVLGIVAAHDKYGIAPKTTPYLASEWKKPLGQPWTENTAEAIVDALMVLEAGDVILIEGQQVYKGQNLPVEADSMIFEAIVAAHNLGITVIEAAGNNSPKGVDLDDVVLADLDDDDPNTTRKLFERDSGAIRVAAGTRIGDPTEYERRDTSNYGSGIHCFADGGPLVALDTPGAAGDSPGDYVRVQGGTSSASAIITGVALMLQGLARHHGTVIHPWTLRERLQDRGTPPVQPDDARIGVMPNLMAMEIDDLIETTEQAAT